MVVLITIILSIRCYDSLFASLTLCNMSVVLKTVFCQINNGVYNYFLFTTPSKPVNCKYNKIQFVTTILNTN